MPCRLCFEGVQAHLGLRPLDAETTCFAEVTVLFTLARPADENVIHPAFSDQALPLKIPFVGLILTPHVGSPPQVPELGAKLIHPAFSDHAYPPRPRSGATQRSFKSSSSLRVLDGLRPKR